MDVKECGSCHETLPVDMFYKNRGRPCYRCKSCMKTKAKINRDENPERFNGRRRDRYKTDEAYRTKIRSKRMNRWNSLSDDQRRAIRIKEHLKNAYGLSEDQYKVILESQGGLCACCRQNYAKPLVVDHDHNTGKVRGLLCPRCNVGIGHLGDSISGLEMAVEYLRSHYSPKPIGV